MITVGRDKPKLVSFSLKSNAALRRRGTVSISGVYCLLRVRKNLLNV